MYVGVTRVKEKLELIYLAFNTDGKVPSTFINEIRDILEYRDNKQARAYSEATTDKVEGPNYIYNKNIKQQSKKNVTNYQKVPKGNKVLHETYEKGVVVNANYQYIIIKFNKDGIKSLLRQSSFDSGELKII